MIVDTHCHLYFDAFDPDRADVIKRAREHGVRWLVNVGTDPVTNPQAHKIASENEGIWHTAGLHPHHSNLMKEEEWPDLEKFIRETKPVAIGEIGLDYFKSEAEPPVQHVAFRRMLRLALEHDLPVIVHSRDAFDDTLAILKEEGKGKLRGVMHCFSYDAEKLGKLFEIGFLASFTCNLTFKNAATLLSVAKEAPLDRIMLETDSPYLAPQIFRGKRNEPATLAHLVEFLSGVRGIEPKELEDRTTDNAIRFFRLPVSA